MKRIVFNPDKSIMFISPFPYEQKENESREDWLKRIFDKQTPKGAVYRDYEDEELPKEHVYFWTGDINSGITVDLDAVNSANEAQVKEKLIQAKIRELAEAELKKEGKLDVSGNLVGQIGK
ncbi:MAG TPA: hypothetical protein VGD14_09510 [bacterium]